LGPRLGRLVPADPPAMVGSHQGLRSAGGLPPLQESTGPYQRQKKEARQEQGRQEERGPSEPETFPQNQPQSSNTPGITGRTAGPICQLVPRPPDLGDGR